MNPYPIDSPHAVVRLLALAVTIDGVPSDAELRTLEQRGVLQALRLSRDDFDDVMDALCADLRQSTPTDRRGFRSLGRSQIRAMLDEIQAPALQREVAALLFDIFSSDHRLVRAESILLWDALDHWGLHLREVSGLIRSSASSSRLLDEACFTRRVVPV
ncbi:MULTISPECIES: hypothetical protein [unclassified Uliginosibacterium]|uniref:hypothetical protein n=1 Tax=unclassified Uliginosibacterium TaxID=2621521 RepID=UPI000C79C35D|nr:MULTISPECIES: hypothetical protein [unclassified Uliginosibacterium]MDO6387549.1 hypothetical protein [Uliginosibacterium sp. 31-12]PLK47403.1 hypothetical protein C0V76_17260 [Uliginosibacterium sp. TH139]